jgi:hypothetical protein
VTSDFAEFDAYEPARDEVADEVPHESGVGASNPASDAASAPVTGNVRVDSATALLDDIDQVPSAAAAEVFEEVHRRLQGALADLDGH